MESWPQIEPDPELSPGDVSANLRRARDLMEREDLDALVVTSSDRWLNEYTPLADNHRFLLSGFTGSTAYLLVLQESLPRLYVDGRYHLQADAETDPGLIEVVKIGHGEMLTATLLRDLRHRRRVGYEADRVSCSFAAALESAARAVLPLELGELETALGGRRLRPTKPIEGLDEALAGRSTAEKLTAVFDELGEVEGAAVLVAALDDLAWLAHARGWHFRYQSSFAGLGVAVPDRLDVFVDRAVAQAGLPAAEPGDVRRWHPQSPEALLADRSFDGIRRLHFDPTQTPSAVVRSLVRRVRPGWELVETRSPVQGVKSRKTPAEIAHLESANARACRAITRAARRLRASVAAGEPVSELAFHDAANRCYADEGARDLSFHTIAAFGASSAIIHFNAPDPARWARPDDLVLLDSGALFEGGMATDVTRTFLAGGPRVQATERQREIHTLVLKGLIQGTIAKVPDGARGCYLDARVRAPLHDAGYDYAHGTGHGVGVHVHEAGVGLSPGTTSPIRAGNVCSIEPGIYLAGYGGVRLENVVVFEPCPETPGFLRARPLSYVGFDEALIDRARLEPRELAWLDDYLAVCAERDTTF